MNNFNKQIWIFWEQGWDNAPLICKICRDSWINNNSTWKINLLDKNNLNDYINPEELIKNFWKIEPIQIRSDIIRLLLLKKFGGIWIDSTCLCNKPLDKWIFKAFNLNNIESCFLFKFNKINISNWFIITHPNNYWINTFSNYFLSNFRNNDNFVTSNYFFFYQKYLELQKTDENFLNCHLNIKKISSSNAKYLEFNENLNKVNDSFNSEHYKNLSPVLKLTHKMNYNLKINTNLYHILKLNNVDVSLYFEKEIKIINEIIKPKKKILKNISHSNNKKFNIIKVNINKKK